MCRTLVAGAAVFVPASLQAACLSLTSRQACTELNRRWFAALLRQDMAHYDTIGALGVKRNAPLIPAASNRHLDPIKLLLKDRRGSPVGVLTRTCERCGGDKRMPHPNLSEKSHLAARNPR